MSRNAESRSSIRKRTPLEQAIAEQSAANARYEAKRKREGFKRTTVWTPEERLPLLLAANKQLANQLAGAEFAESFAAFLHEQGIVP